MNGRPPEDLDVDVVPATRHEPAILSTGGGLSVELRREDPATGRRRWSGPGARTNTACRLRCRRRGRAMRDATRLVILSSRVIEDTVMCRSRGSVGTYCSHVTKLDTFACTSGPCTGHLLACYCKHWPNCTTKEKLSWVQFDQNAPTNLKARIIVTLKTNIYTLKHLKSGVFMMGQQIGLLHSTVSLCVYVSQLPTDGLSESKP